MIKSFKRNKRSSANTASNRTNISRLGPASIGSPNVETNSLESPKKVIKALYDYQPQGPGELKFSKGDFFHILHNFDETKENEGDGWCEVVNPMSHVKGMVPITYFEVFNRSRPREVSNTVEKEFPNSSGKKAQTLYAVTMYNFVAEREDELDIKPGENLIICAHHNYEWFIAKPINRLGGPGLVPASYVKMIDLLNPMNTEELGDNIVDVINKLKIPTVDEWKLSTAKYQASTIPLGSISSQSSTVSSNTQYFQKENRSTSSRSSLSSQNTTIIEAGVESYQFDRGRYQYLVVTKLSNGKMRYLYRYYQDFYDLQVRLLELFPYEAGKVENSKRIIPSIPGPLINVNDSISKLRREKLDFYLRNLIALPSHISRSEEVLKLFEVLDNGLDREVQDSIKEKRTSKPISQKSNYQQDRLSQYSTLHYISTGGGKSSTPVSSDSTLSRSMSSSSANIINNADSFNTETSAANEDAVQTEVNVNHEHPPSNEGRTKVKVKFYHDDDIFVLLLPTNLKLHDLKTKLHSRLNLNFVDSDIDERIHILLKNDYDSVAPEIVGSYNSLKEDEREKLEEDEIRTTEYFQRILYEKCKLVILVT